MANYATTKAALDAAIRTNGVQAITGAVLNTILNDILAVLGKHYQFGGLVTPDAAFTAGDEKVAFFAVEAGTYTNFGGVTLDGKTLHILTYDSAWHDADTSIPSGAAFEAALALAIKGSQSGIAEGIADTISAGTAQEFLQRQSGGDGVNCIKRIKGKTIAWNQLIQNGNFASKSLWVPYLADYSVSDNVATIITTAGNGAVYQDIPVVAGHKYYFAASVKSDGTNVAEVSLQQSAGGTVIASASSSWTRGSIIVTAGSQANIRVAVSLRVVAGTFYAANIFCVDLTLLGLGDLTAAQFEARYPKNYYPYNAGVLKSNDAAALLTDGRNQWDEEWEAKAWSPNKTKYSASGYVCSKNIIRAIPGATIYIKSPTDIQIIVWDASGNAIFAGGIGKNMTYTFANNAYEWAFYTNYGGPYANDICINLSDASFNGTYEPYWSRVLALRLSELTGIPEGGTEADRVTMFPNGLGGAGSAFDSIFVENGVAKARKTMLAEVDLGDLDYTYETEYSRFAAPVEGIKRSSASRDVPLICSKYIGIYDKRPIADVPDKSCYTGAGTDNVSIKDTAYTDAATFKAAVAGVKLLAEAATPIVYTDLQYADGTPFTMPATILVDNYGTERIQAPEGATTPSAPFCCDSNYSIGVANLVKRLAALENAE